MLTKILSTATLIIVAWLSVQMVRTQQALQVTQTNVQDSVVALRTELDESVKKSDSLGADVLARMDVLSQEQVKLANSSNKGDPKKLKAKDQIITRLNQEAQVRNVIATVLQADLLGHEKQGDQAAELLLSTKSAIWKASEKWANSKDALRGLMAPIDILAGRWKRGDFTGNTKKIQAVLLDAISAQSQS